MTNTFNYSHYYCKTDTFKELVFSKFEKMIKLDDKIKVTTSFPLFKAFLLKMGNPDANSTYKIYHSIGIRFLMLLRLGRSLNNEHKVILNFPDCRKPLRCCNLKPETALHFFLHQHSLGIRKKTV